MKTENKKALFIGTGHLPRKITINSTVTLRGGG